MLSYKARRKGENSCKGHVTLHATIFHSTISHQIDLYIVTEGDYQYNIGQKIRNCKLLIVNVSKFTAKVYLCFFYVEIGRLSMLTDIIKLHGNLRRHSSHYSYSVRY